VKYLLSLALLAAATLVLAQTDRERAAGKAVFDQWCAPCHAPGPRHPGTQALEVLYGGAKPAALEERGDLVPEITRAFVRTGASVMPPFRKTEVSDEELEAVARYLAPR
jgi:(+)-pinoresinol hydroxylase